MQLLQYIEYRLDKAIDMLMRSGASKIEVVLYLEDLKKILKGEEKEIVDGDFKEVGIRGIEKRGLIKDDWN